MSSNKKQSWQNCEYATGVIGDNGIPSYVLEEHEFFNIYCCENKEILKLGAYNTEVVWFQYRSDRYFSKEIAALTTITNVRNISEEDKKGLRIKVEIGTAMCKHCKYHKLKEKK
jgi:hypothetical protein